jgi:hypothetical protein
MTLHLEGGIDEKTSTNYTPFQGFAMWGSTVVKTLPYLNRKCEVNLEGPSRSFYAFKERGQSVNMHMCS